jgi:putative phage-type endonuclease
MTATDLRQNTPAWEDARQSVDFIGASDVPIITGSSPYRDTSAYDLWAYKTGRLERLPVKPETQELFDIGHAIEAVIAERHEAMSGKRLRRVNRTLQSRTVPWAKASIDRVVVGERTIVELKWDPWARYGREQEGVPMHVLEQVQWQLWVAGYEAAEVAVLMGSHVSRFEIEPDRDFQDDLFYIVDRFRTDHLLGDVPPPVDGSEATRKAIARLHPDDNGELMEPTAEVRALMGELHRALPVEQAASETVSQLKNALRSALGDFSGAEGDGWRISYKKAKPRRSVDWRGLASAYLSTLAEQDRTSLLETYTTEDEGSRRLLPKWDGGA